MKFLLSHEQNSIQDSIQQTAARVLGGRGLHEIIDGKREKETALWQELSALGVFGVTVPESHGGQGLGLVELALISEVLGYTAAPGPFLGHALATLAIDLGGDEKQRSAWLPKLASGEVTASVAFGEPGGRWLPEQWTVTGDAKISGTKTHVIGGDEAALIVVGLAGGGLGLIEAGASGVTRERLTGVDRTRPLSRIRFENAPIALLPNGQEAAPRVIDAGLALLAADSFGVGRRCVEMAVEYSQQREQFGVKIAQFQALRHQLANMVLEVEPCRGLYWFAAHAWDKKDAQARHAAALAKSHIGDRCLQAARDNIEAHGGIGFTWEFDAHIYFKRAMFDFEWLGNATVHRARVADLAAW
jgi:alkylation response protein AidB-like acyl-CoA dehydrogenase